mmetsp:Transcript_45903/g.106722  ORF Transcript_45903/g.106722 Transcript_45903/m.106722 type:complete len:368 (+) Transcript_45903:89-1192(+)
MSSSGQVNLDPLSGSVTVQKPHLAAPSRGPTRMEVTAREAGLVATGLSAPACWWLTRKMLQPGSEAISPREFVADIKQRLPKALRKSPWKFVLLTPTTLLAGLGAALAMSSRRRRRAERTKHATRAVAMISSPRSSVCSALSSPRSTLATPRGPQRVPTVHRMASKSPERELMDGQRSVTQWYRLDVDAPETERHDSSCDQADPQQAKPNALQQPESVVDITGCASMTLRCGAPPKSATVVPPEDWLSEEDDAERGISSAEEQADCAVEAAWREGGTNSTGISDNDADDDSPAETLAATLPFPWNQREPALKFQLSSNVSGRHPSCSPISAHEIQAGHIASTRPVFQKHRSTVSMPLRGHRGDLMRE